MLKQRVITAVVLAAIFLAALFGLPGEWFSLFVAGFILIAAWEWASLSAANRIAGIAFYSLMAILMAGLFNGLGVSTQNINPACLREILLIGCFWWAIALLWVQGYPSSAVLWGSTFVRLIIGVLVLLPPWLALSWLVTLETGRWLVILVILIVACADIGAYFSGRAFGRHKLAVEVSPGKTWEGFAGGLLAVLIMFSVIFAANFLSSGTWWQWLIIALATALVSVLGDLLESMVKRHRGVKDSGKILPGHGGVLDRIDGLTSALPVFALLYLLLIHQ